MFVVGLSQAGEPPPPPIPDDPKGWVFEGLPRDESSDPYKRRHRHPGGDKFSLSDQLKARLPKVDKQGLAVLRSFVNGKGGGLPFMFFEKTFPTEAQDVVLREVRKTKVAFCVFQQYFASYL